MPYEIIYQAENITRYKIDTNKIYPGGWCSGFGLAITYASYHSEVIVFFSIAPYEQTEFIVNWIKVI